MRQFCSTCKPVCGSDKYRNKQPCCEFLCYDNVYSDKLLGFSQENPCTAYIVTVQNCRSLPLKGA